MDANFDGTGAAIEHTEIHDRRMRRRSRSSADQGGRKQSSSRSVNLIPRAPAKKPRILARITWRFGRAGAPTASRSTIALGHGPSDAPCFEPGELCAAIDGFSLHAQVHVEAGDRERLEHLCRYVCRPALASERLSLDERGRVLLELRHPWRDATTHIVFEPLVFLERLAALVPRPREHQLTYHGVLAPASSWRDLVVPVAAAERSGGAHPISVPIRTIRRPPCRSPPSETRSTIPPRRSPRLARPRRPRAATRGPISSAVCSGSTCCAARPVARDAASSL